MNHPFNVYFNPKSYQAKVDFTMIILSKGMVRDSKSIKEEAEEKKAEVEENLNGKKTVLVERENG